MMLLTNLKIEEFLVQKANDHKLALPTKTDLNHHEETIAHLIFQTKTQFLTPNDIKRNTKIQLETGTQEIKK